MESWEEFGDLTRSAIAAQYAQKEEYLRQALLRGSIRLDLEREKVSRFKSLICEMQDGRSTYYYNDGSINGLKLVSFEETIPGFLDVQFHV